MNRLLSLIDANTELSIRRGSYPGELCIKCTRHVDESNTFNVEIRFNMDDVINRMRISDDYLWQHVYEEIHFKLRCKEMEMHKKE